MTVGEETSVNVCQDSITFSITFVTPSDFAENLHIGAFQHADYETEVWLAAHPIV